jgi:hypothetical protein
MPLSKLFWFLAIITLVFIALQAMGYSVMEVVLSLLIIDVVVVEVSRQLDKSKLTNEFKHEILSRFNIIENMCKNINYSLKFEGDFDHKLNEVIRGNKIAFKRTDEIFKDSMDKMAKKLIEVENSMNRMKRTFSSAIAAFDDRISSLETPQPLHETADGDYVELESFD